MRHVFAAVVLAATAQGGYLRGWDPAPPPPPALGSFSIVRDPEPSRLGLTRQHSTQTLTRFAPRRRSQLADEDAAQSLITGEVRYTDESISLNGGGDTAVALQVCTFGRLCDSRRESIGPVTPARAHHMRQPGRT